MEQKVIQVGNSLAVTIPRSFARSIKLKAGQRVMLDEDIELETLTIQKKSPSLKQGSITPEFVSWLKKFNRKYKTVLTELARK